MICRLNFTSSKVINSFNINLGQVENGEVCFLYRYFELNIVNLKNNEIIDALTFDESYQGTFFGLRIDTSNPALYDSEEEEDFVW